MPQQRRRFKHTDPLKDRLAAFAKDMRAKASRLSPGTEQDELLRKARRADDASHFAEWASSPGSPQPK
jgi:hypothetical protein